MRLTLTNICSKKSSSIIFSQSPHFCSFSTLFLNEEFLQSCFHLTGSYWSFESTGVILVPHLAPSKHCITCIITAAHLAAFSTSSCRALVPQSWFHLYFIQNPDQIGYLIFMTIAELEGTIQKFVRLRHADKRMPAERSKKETEKVPQKSIII